MNESEYRTEYRELLMFGLNVLLKLVAIGLAAGLTAAWFAWEKTKNLGTTGYTLMGVGLMAIGLATYLPIALAKQHMAKRYPAESEPEDRPQD